MKELVRAIPGRGVELYSLSQLRQDNPNVSFSQRPSSVDLAPFHVFWGEMPDRPDDTRDTRVEGPHWRQAGGEWVADWTSRPATPEEQAQWDAALPPSFDEFREALMADPACVEAFELAMRGAPMAAPLLGSRLDDFERSGNSVPFLRALRTSLSGVPQDAVRNAKGALVAAARSARLPADFCEALEALPREAAS